MNIKDVEAVHITDECEVNYTSLQHKWKKHLPPGRKTGDALEDLKKIFPETFDGQVGLFEGEVSLKLAAPKDKQELKSLLGTVNFMSNFIPNLTKKTYLMRSLMKKNVHFIWSKKNWKSSNLISSM